MIVFTPKKGFDYNPLYRNGNIRNEPCPCDSGKKIKKCCGTLPMCKADHARMFTEWLADKEGANA